MKNYVKLALGLALCGMFVACDDSGSSATDEVSSSSEVNMSSSQKQQSSSSVESVNPEIPQGDESSSTKVSSSSHSELVSESSSSSNLNAANSSSSEDNLSSSEEQLSSSSVDSEVPQGEESSSSDESSSSSVESSSSDESSSSFSGIDPSTVIKGTMTDERDGKVYKTVTIGEQTWMAENLNYAYNEKTSSEDSSSFCYNNSADSCSKYGRLYLWSAAMDSAAVFSTDGEGCGYDTTCSASGTVRGVCPEGWHLPNHTEWSTLFTAVGGTSSAGTVLKSTSGWNSSGNGEDSYGFSVVPAGDRYYDGYFDYAGKYANFWSSTEGSSNDAYYWYFRYSDAREDNYNKNLAFSVRCVRN